MARQRKQLQIAGTEPVCIPELDEAAEEYVAFRDERMALAQKETASRVRVIDEMKKNNLNTYNFEDSHGKARKVALVTPDPKVSVKLVKVSVDGNAADGDGGDAGDSGSEGDGVDVS